MLIIFNPQPDYKRAELEAYRLLQNHQVRELPVMVKKIAQSFPNLRIKTYSWVAERHNMSLQQVCELIGSDEGCCILEKSTGRYLILYNDHVTNIGRIRWTLAHELGHFILRHNERTDKAVFARSELTDDEYEAFEKEANCFARTLLAPPKVITALGITDEQTLASICGLSLEAASNVLKFIKTGIEIGRTFSEAPYILNQFRDFILSYKKENPLNFQEIATAKQTWGWL